MDDDEWLWWAVDLLASEYGWAKREILEHVYLDELYAMVPKINRRKLADYKMEMAIVQNPHVKNPKELWAMLDQQEKQFEPQDDKFDPAGFDRFKNALRKNPKFNVK